jgi:hypothetical protein
MINNANHGIPPCLVALIRTLLYFGPITKKQLMELCHPPNLGNSAGSSDSKNKLGATYTTWEGKGLILEDKECIYLSKEFAPELTAVVPNQNSAKLQELVRTKLPESVFRAVLADMKDSPAQKRDDCFGRAAAWLMMIDSLQQAHSSNQEEAQIGWQKAFKTNEPFSKNGWNGMRLWMDFFECIWTLPAPDGKASRSFIFDPTPFLRWELRAIFGGKTSLEAADFIGKMSEHIPFFAGGSIYREVEESLKSNMRLSVVPDTLPLPLSLALLRLAEEKLIKMDPARSDSLDNAFLWAPTLESRRSIGTISLVGANK